ELLAVDEQSLARLDVELAALADVPLRRQRIEEAARRLPDEQQRAEGLTSRLETRERQLREILREQEQLSERLVDRDRLQDRHDELAAAVGLARQALLLQRDQRVRLEDTVARQRRQAEELRALREQLKQAGRDRTVAEHLAAAYGRDGIPALIIENAVPEIEKEANRLLQLLSGDRMQLAIRLQKPLQSGGERETLEIEISDELGTRSYENYSGGEAFRVNFALRLALSQLLAKRVQARLRTLIIDEGFGTQDDEGIDQLVEALHLVRDDFDLILVVTHLVALKDRFPSRVEIYKDPSSGSNFTLFGPAG
ncbi:MAG: SMC family ATPase, partial [Armatimonadetes bacterium]|nr:SMC family ATPase [Armatimonadota bacterium]